MGNACVGKKKSNKGVVHPVIVHGVGDHVVTIKVRMTKGQLKDLIEKVDTSNANTELGNLIVRECFKGRLGARVVDGDHDSYKFSRGQSLRSIQEHTRY